MSSYKSITISWIFGTYELHEWHTNKLHKLLNLLLNKQNIHFGFKWMLIWMLDPIKYSIIHLYCWSTLHPKIKQYPIYNAEYNVLLCNMLNNSRSYITVLVVHAESVIFYIVNRSCAYHHLATSGCYGYEGVVLLSQYNLSLTMSAHMV